MKQKLAPGSLFPAEYHREADTGESLQAHKSRDSVAPRCWEMPTAVTSDKSGSWVQLSCIPGNTVAPGCYFRTKQDSTLPWKGQTAFLSDKDTVNPPLTQKLQRKPEFSPGPLLSVLFVQIRRKFPDQHAGFSGVLLWSRIESSLKGKAQSKPPGSYSQTRIWSWCSRKCYLDLLGTNT